jgi:hypothetical protein
MIFKKRFVKVFSLAALALTMASQAKAEDPMSAVPGAGLDTQDSLTLNYTINAVSKIDIRALGSDGLTENETDAKELTDIRSAVDMAVANLRIKTNQPSTVYACSDNGSELVLAGSSPGVAGESVAYSLQVAGAGISLPENAGSGLAPVSLSACALAAASNLDVEVASVNDPENTIDEDYAAGSAREMRVTSAGDEALLAGAYSDVIRLVIEAN